MDTNFVVYACLREDGTPYYVGKGRPQRPYRKEGRPCNPPPRERIVILHEGISEDEAFRIETELIVKYGRKDLDPVNGLLHNRTFGGEGASGVVVSTETRAKMSSRRMGPKNHNYLPRDWYHPEHGEVLQKSSGELRDMFPEMKLNTKNLDSVYRREKSYHKGWRRLDDKDKYIRRKNHAPQNWFHSVHGVIYDKSITELLNLYPDMKLSASALCRITKGHLNSHKGWKLLS
jgi:hypothetical protein